MLKADSPWGTAVWLGRSDGTDEHLVGEEIEVLEDTGREEADAR